MDGRMERAEEEGGGRGCGKGVVYAYEASEAKKKGEKLLRHLHRWIFF
jgi:hypothetical protein